MPKITARQERFALEFVASLNATAAAIKAGYSEKTAAQIGHQLIEKPSVRARIAELQKAARERLDLTVDDVVNMLLRMAVDAQKANQYGPAVRAVELVGKRLGAFVDRFTVETPAQGATPQELVDAIGIKDDAARAELLETLAHIPVRSGGRAVH